MFSRSANMTDEANSTDPAPLPDMGSSPPAVPSVTTSPATVLSVLHEILGVIAHGETQEFVLNLVTQKVCLMTGSGSSAIALLDDGADTVTFVAVAGEQAEEMLGSQVRLTDTVAGNTARTGEPFLAYRPLLTGGNPPRVESALVVPIYDDGVPVGSLTALNKAGNLPFDGTDFLTLSTLSNIAAIVIGSTRLRQNEQRQSRELTMLNEAVRRVSGQLTAQEVLQAVVEQASKHIESTAVVAFLTNDERTHLYIAEESGLTEEEREITLAADSGVGRLLLTDRGPSLIRFTDSDEEMASLPFFPGRLLQTAPIFPERSARTALAAPIRAGDTAHGLVLALSDTDEFSNAETNLLTAVAAQAAVALENASLYEDATRRAEEAAALYELSQAVTSTLRLPDILERVADAVLHLVSVDKFALFLRERHGDVLELVFQRGLPEGASERLRPRIGQGIIGWVMEFETPTAVRDIAADQRNASAPFHTEGAVSLVAMPLQLGTSTIGVLTALSSRRRLFTVAEMELLYTIANQAAVAIENARVYTTVRRKSSDVRKFFHRVARALSATRSPQNVPELIASLTQDVMEADRCVLHAVRRGPEGRALVEVAAAVGFRVESGGGPVPVVAASPTGWVVQQARPLTVENLPDDPRFSAGYDRPVRGGIMSYLGVPLRGGSEVIGVLEVYTRDHRHWQAEEVRLLLTFATQAAVAFRNARLAQEGERSERTARLLERLLNMATHTEEVQAEEVVAALALGLNAPILTFYREESHWRTGTASSAPDPFTLAALSEALEAGKNETVEFQVAYSPGREVAVAVLLGSGAGATRQLVLETAATLLSRAR
ncbi:MAG: GAF domain-containing protein [Capsulimonadales bacterium]|nr:GAF domain-containing protein [Capsulimonadales bacterium]